MKIRDLLDAPVPTVPELALKYHVSVHEVQAALDKGIKVEQEHTTHAHVARQIALAHLAERLDYYDELAKIDETTRTSKVGAPGTLKAKISRLYGGAVTCDKAQKLKTRPGATAHDKSQANWFQNMNCGGATRVNEVFNEPAIRMPWRSYGSGAVQFWETEFQFQNQRVSVEMHPDVRQVGAKYVYSRNNMDLPVHDQGWLVIFKVDNSTDVTGQMGTQSVKLFTQVVSVIKGFLQNHVWDYVLFTGDEGSRNRLYDVLAHRLAAQVGGHVLQKGSDFLIHKPAHMSEQGGVGLVMPGVNMPAGMHADEIRRQAKKFGNRVSAHGVPPIVNTSGKLPR